VKQRATKQQKEAKELAEVRRMMTGGGGKEDVISAISRLLDGCRESFCLSLLHVLSGASGELRRPVVGGVSGGNGEAGRLLAAYNMGHERRAATSLRTQGAELWAVDLYMRGVTNAEARRRLKRERRVNVSRSALGRFWRALYLAEKGNGESWRETKIAGIAAKLRQLDGPYLAGVLLGLDESLTKREKWLAARAAGNSAESAALRGVLTA